MPEKRLGVTLAPARSCSQYFLVRLLHGSLDRLLPRPPLISDECQAFLRLYNSSCLGSSTYMFAAFRNRLAPSYCVLLCICFLRLVLRCVHPFLFCLIVLLYIVFLHGYGVPGEFEDHTICIAVATINPHWH